MAKEEKSDKAVNPELEQLQKLYDLMLEKGLEAIELKDEESRVRLTRRLAGAPLGSFVPRHTAPSRSDNAQPAPENIPAASNVQSIPTPLSGVFYRQSSPTSAPFIKEGDTVDAGQTLCIVEAMKVMNEIKAESPCRIVKIVAENGKPVTAGQPLFEIESS